MELYYTASGYATISKVLFFFKQQYSLKIFYNQAFRRDFVYNGNKAEVKVNTITKRETVFMWILTVVVTLLFYYILKHFNTANIIPSTLSVTTSFVAVYLTFRRSPYYAVAYAANDIILIILWVIASLSDIRYISVVVCFTAFFTNDIYGYVSWQKMMIRQNKPGK